VVPGDPATLMLGTTATEEQIRALREELGLNEPLVVQYGRYLADVVRLDFGESFMLGGSALGHVLDRLPATLLLAAAALVVALAISFPLGIAAAKNPQGFIDKLISASSLTGQALPEFWVGIMLILLFARYLEILPSAGSGSWQHLILPAFALALPFIGWLTRLVRGGLLEELREDYVQTARAKGLSERVIFYVHVLRNALVPVVTVIGLLVGEFVGSAVIVEVVFAWPGVGRLMVDSINFRDYAVVEVAIAMITAVYVFLNLAVDVLYGFLDPRIRMEEQ
jgi:peptide/nickel transport system permease protein